MNEYEVVNKTYVKSNNHSSIIMARYTYSLIVFTILSLIINLFIGNKDLVLASFKSIGISLVISSVITYLINLTRKKYNFLDIFVKDNTILIALIMGLFGINTNTYILILAIIITLLIKHFSKNINISSVLYGILIILLYNHYVGSINNPLIMLKELNYDVEAMQIIKDGGGILNYLFGINYLSPVLAVIMFLYLFYKKGIKYNIVIYYILSLFIIMFIFSLFKEEIWLVFILLLSQPIIFLAIYALTDYKCSPTILEVQMIYGIIVGTITSILMFIIPEFSVVISMILGSLLLVRPLDKFSPKIKYNKKIYNITIIISFGLVIGISFIIAMIF